ncbi:phasin protein [Roseiarcus fermentans]|uniref:Phasin protein n=1 Tax=Roseiarcus fermentans TaxID=1473586 RepID=A0A366EJE6_9HYPH|nr:phasin family protein [Roseiarcus fermentans]RBP02542.1 phasin protein [Roseiarcus fermentans]
MAQEVDNAANATEQAANVVAETAKAGEAAGERAAKAGKRYAVETAKAGGQAGRVGERFVADTAERIESASRTYGGAVEAVFKAVQDYNAKLLQIFQSNAEANLRLGQTLMQARSPADFVETMGRAMRDGVELVAGQAKDLAAIRRDAARRVMEAMTTSGR